MFLKGIWSGFLYIWRLCLRDKKKKRKREIGPYLNIRTCPYLSYATEMTRRPKKRFFLFQLLIVGDNNLVRLMINEIHHGRDISFSIFTAERKSFFVLSKWLVLLNNHTHVWYFLLTLLPENKKKRKSLTSSVKLSISEGYFYRRGKNRARFGKTS